MAGSAVLRLFFTKEAPEKLGSFLFCRSFAVNGKLIDAEPVLAVADQADVAGLHIQVIQRHGQLVLLAGTQGLVMLAIHRLLDAVGYPRRLQEGLQAADLADLTEIHL